jgi:hypothetical protein
MNSLDKSDVRQRAYENIVKTIDLTVHLPKQVFKKEWSNFLFFQSDWMFTKEFPRVIDEMLLIEKANVCCLLNLSLTPSMNFEEIAAIYIGEKITDDEYYSKLQADGPSNGWLYGVDTYACMSDAGEWCIYCERSNDVAVIGFRNDSESQKFRSSLDNLHAKPILDLIDGGVAPLIPFNRLVPEWSSALIQNYPHNSSLD